MSTGSWPAFVFLIKMHAQASLCPHIQIPALLPPTPPSCWPISSIIRSTNSNNCLPSLGPVQLLPQVNNSRISRTTLGAHVVATPRALDARGHLPGHAKSLIPDRVLGPRHGFVYPRWHVLIEFATAALNKHLGDGLQARRIEIAMPQGRNSRSSRWFRMTGQGE